MGKILSCGSGCRRTILKTTFVGILVLAAFGDLRNLVGSFGYWFAWGAILFFGCFSVRPKKLGLLPTVGFLILALGFILASLVNGDPATLYQAAKLIVIGLLVYLTILIQSNMAESDVEQAFRVVVVLVFLVYWVARLLIPFWRVELGDGRQGVIISYPGVIWKIGFFGFLYFVVTANSRRLLTSICFISISAFLILIDGSRTAFILALGCIVALWFRWFAFDARAASQVALIVVLGALLASLLASLAFEDFNDFLVFNRLSGGDEHRIAMFKEALRILAACGTLGCGWGSAMAPNDLLADGYMVIHNAYLEALIDGGMLAFLGLLIVTLGSLVQASHRSSKHRLRLNTFSALGIGSIAFLYLFHPLGTEMSEWGWMGIVVGAGYVRAKNYSA